MKVESASYIGRSKERENDGVSGLSDESLPHIQPMLEVSKPLESPSSYVETYVRPCCFMYWAGLNSILNSSFSWVFLDLLGIMKMVF